MTIRELIDSLMDQLETGDGDIVFQVEDGTNYKGVLDITIDRDSVTIIHLNEMEEPNAVDTEQEYIDKARNEVINPAE